MVKNLFKGCLTVPNLLSLIRIFLIPAFAVLYYKGHIGWAVLMLALSGISDFLDGKSPAASIRSASSERYSIPSQIS